MEKIQKEYEVYNFEELDKKIQEKLIEEEQEDQLYNKIVTMNKELEKIGFNLIESDPDIESTLDFLKDRKYLKDGSVFE